MADRYEAFYGVEPFAALGSPPAQDYGGGSVITQENLLIGLWRVEGGGALNRIKPFAEDPLNAGIVDVIGPAFTSNVFQSKLSTRVAIEFEQGAQAAAYQLVLQPPRELKQLYLEPNSPATINPASPLGFDYNFQKNAYLSGLAWTAVLYVAGIGSVGIPLGEADVASFLVGSQSLAPLPLLRTSGADGQAPEFYEVGTPAEAVASINAVKRGEPFFVPFRFSLNIPDDFPEVVVDIHWHNSPGRI